jgi:hypothetical protein
MLRPVVSDSARETLKADDGAAAAAAAERHRRHKQSERRARSSINTSRGTDTSSHQQPVSGAPQENESPQAAQLFKVGALPSNVSSASPLFILTWLEFAPKIYEIWRWMTFSIDSFG